MYPFQQSRNGMNLHRPTADLLLEPTTLLLSFSYCQFPILVVRLGRVNHAGSALESSYSESARSYSPFHTLCRDSIRLDRCRFVTCDQYLFNELH